MLDRAPGPEAPGSGAQVTFAKRHTVEEVPPI